MMDKISDVTRQDIIDVIRNGFVVSFDEPQYDSIVVTILSVTEVKYPIMADWTSLDFWKDWLYKNLVETRVIYNGVLAQ